MKTRQGFVSNSSSSSFVVAFPRKPLHVDDLQEMMFTSFQTHVRPYDYSAPVEDICDQVYKDIRNQGESAGPSDVKEHLRGIYGQEMRRLLGRDWDRSSPSRKDYPTEEEWRDAWEAWWDDYNARAREFEGKMAREFLERNKDTFVLCTSYSDNDGSFFSAMEHGGIFRNLDHIQVSNH